MFTGARLVSHGSRARVWSENVEECMFGQWSTKSAHRILAFAVCREHTWASTSDLVHVKNTGRWEDITVGPKVPTHRNLRPFRTTKRLSISKFVRVLTSNLEGFILSYSCRAMTLGSHFLSPAISDVRELIQTTLIQSSRNDASIHIKGYWWGGTVRESEHSHSVLHQGALQITI